MSTIPLAKKVKCVIGLDSEDMMLKDLLKNAEIAGVANILDDQFQVTSDRCAI